MAKRFGGGGHNIKRRVGHRVGRGVDHSEVFIKLGGCVGSEGVYSFGVFKYFHIFYFYFFTCKIIKSFLK